MGDVVIVGDKTTTGGVIKTGNGGVKINGQPVALIGDIATCLCGSKSCRGQGPIVPQSSRAANVSGVDLARVGDLVDTGCGSCFLESSSHQVSLTTSTISPLNMGSGINISNGVNINGGGGVSFGGVNINRTATRQIDGAEERYSDASGTSRKRSTHGGDRPDSKRTKPDRWEIFKGDWDIRASKESAENSGANNVVADVRFNYRYVVSDNTGGLKYEPVTVDRVLDPSKNSNTESGANELERTYYRRKDSALADEGAHKIEAVTMRTRSQRSTVTEPINHNTVLHPAKNNGDPIIVPSVGMPREFEDKNFLKRLHWFNESSKRPVILFVHTSEAQVYREKMNGILREHGIGLVSWGCNSHSVGFGATRQAVIGYMRNRTNINATMMDHNVLNSQYDLVEAGGKATSGVGFNSSLYFGLGETSSNLTGNNNASPLSQAASGRPIEQVTRVNNNINFDEAFISSSEDIDMTKDIIFFESVGKEAEPRPSSLKLRDSESGKHPKISKTKLTEQSMNYRNLVDDRIASLSDEGRMLVRVKVDDGIYIVSINMLAEYIANKLGKDKSRIRSLIVEKILLKYKHGSRKIPYHNPHRKEADFSDTNNELGMSGDTGR